MERRFFKENCDSYSTINRLMLKIWMNMLGICAFMCIYIYIDIYIYIILFKLYCTDEYVSIYVYTWIHCVLTKEMFSKRLL